MNFGIVTGNISSAQTAQYALSFTKVFVGLVSNQSGNLSSGATDEILIKDLNKTNIVVLNRHTYGFYLVLGY